MFKLLALRTVWFIFLAIMMIVTMDFTLLVDMVADLADLVEWLRKKPHVGLSDVWIFVKAFAWKLYVLIKSLVWILIKRF